MASVFHHLLAALCVADLVFLFSLVVVSPVTSSSISSISIVSETRSSWLNCALRDDEAVNWVSIGHYEAVAIGN